MQRAVILQFFAAALVLLAGDCCAVPDAGSSATTLPQLPFFHRFSSQLKEKGGYRVEGWAFPPMNSPEYHQLLVRRDLARHGRKLATSKTALTFFNGNITVQSNDGLHYAIIDVGTPMVSHFVALDTGSDLFWLPCECNACASASSPAFAELPDLNVHTPSKSSTSKEMTCGSVSCSAAFSTCDAQNIPPTGQCTYEAVYGSPNTSTSGTVFQDVVHLRSNGEAATDITSPIILGCGQTQTGNLVDGTSVPDGLLGLGRQPFSMPSMLASSGVVGDSFSVCFDIDLSGRIIFGDYGSSTQLTTPLISSSSQAEASYYVGVESILVGNKSFAFGEPTLFDTGTTVSILQTSIYKPVLASFESQVKGYNKTVFDGLFDLCYLTSDVTLKGNPVLAYNLSGDALFQVILPVVPYYFAVNGNLAGFCVALVDGGQDTNIFGVNFMIGYNLVFNREEPSLSFELADCYTTTSSSRPGLSPSTSPASSPGQSRSPVLAPSISSSPTASAPIITSPPHAGGKLSAAARTSISLLCLLFSGLLSNFLFY